jgi:Nicotinic acid phosphoribosyltransferase
MSEKLIDFEKYTDKYFLRAYDILQKENLNPFVRAQIFVRKGPGIIFGMQEAIDFILTHSDLKKNGGKIYALSDGDTYQPLETILLIETPVLDIIRLETVYLGIISSALAIHNDGQKLDLESAQSRMQAAVSAAENRPVTYFGSRHWHYKEDAAIAAAAVRGGAVGAATDVGAACVGKKGSGTIPHALENIFAWKDGAENAVKNATLAFDKHMPADIARVALIDYNNKEIEDTLKTAKAVPALFAIRIDTCGENVGQGALSFSDFDGKTAAEKDVFLQSFFNLKAPLQISEKDEKYWFGTGVSVSGVYALRKALNDNGFGHIQIMLSSGFGDANKVKAFTAAEKILGIRLFDSLGVGGIYDSRDSTMDIVAVGDTIDSMIPMSKVGRTYRPNSRLKRIQD